MARQKRKSPSSPRGPKSGTYDSGATSASSGVVGVSPTDPGRPRTRWPWLVLGLVILGVVGGAAYVWKARERPVLELHGKRPSIVLVTLDTTRRDALGLYGGKVETPNLDRLGAEGVVFETAISPVPLTLPSHASMMTGLFPFQHGVHQNGFYTLPSKFTTVAEILQAKGYKTAAFVGSMILLSRFGLNQGFETYDAPFGRHGRREGIEERSAEEVVAMARKWLAKNGPSPFFLWVHVYDAHAPYHPPDVFLRRYETNRYEGELAYIDWALGPLFQDLRARTEPTVIAVAGDHGESLGEHHESTHGYFVYDSVQRVPLLFWGPSLFAGGRRISDQVGTPALHRTLLEIAGIDSTETPLEAAASLVPALLGGKAPAQDQVLESDTATEQFGAAGVRALRTGKWKWIDVPEPELYDLTADPNEAHNVVAQNTNVAAELKTRLHRRFEDAPAGDEAIASNVEPELRETLESLGYVASKSRVRVVDPTLDPKTTVPLLPIMQMARDALKNQDAKRAYELFDQIVKTCRTARIALMQRGRAAVMMADYIKAIDAFKDLVAAFPEEAVGYYNLGVALMVIERHADARAQFERAIELDPTAPDEHYALGVACVALGDKVSARRHLEEFLKMMPKGPDSDSAARILASLAASHPGNPGTPPPASETPGP